MLSFYPVTRFQVCNWNVHLIKNIFFIKAKVSIDKPSENSIFSFLP